MTSESTLHSFYRAFQTGNAQKMSELYADEATFEDPAFGRINAKEVRAMWEMLIKRGGPDLKIDFEVLYENDQSGKVRWQAYYVFSKTKRPVHNIIEASFKLSNGEIIAHIDHFNFYRWSKQALGTTGLLLGWTPFLKKKVRKMSLHALNQYMDKKG